MAGVTACLFFSYICMSLLILIVMITHFFSRTEACNYFGKTWFWITNHYHVINLLPGLGFKLVKKIKS